MRLEDALGLRFGGKDALEARLGGQVVWSAEPGGWTIADLFADGQGALSYLTEAANTYTDLDGTTNVLATGDLVASVDDMYGPVSYRATQATAAQRPAFVSATKMYSYDGSDDSLDTGTEYVGNTGLFCGPDEEFFLAIAVRIPPGSNGTIVARCTAALADRTFIIYTTDSDDQEPAFRVRGTITSTGWGLRDNALHVIWCNWDGATATAGHDNVAGDTITLDVGGAAEEVGERIHVASRDNDGGYYMEMDGGSLIIRDQAATPDEIENTVNWLLDYHS